MPGRERDLFVDPSAPKSTIGGVDGLRDHSWPAGSRRSPVAKRKASRLRPK
jgi:hypothetical protein